MSERIQTSFSLSRPLLKRLRDAASRNERRLSEEIEARLMVSLDLQGTEHALLLRVDDGLMAWLKAYVKGWSFFGDLNATCVWGLRSWLLEEMKSTAIYGDIAKYLPPTIRDHVMQTPKYHAYLAGRRA